MNFLGMKFLVLLVTMFASLPATAHVKWFSKTANCLSAPVTTLEILAMPLFWCLGTLALSAMFVTGRVDNRVSNGDNLLARIAERLDARAVCLVSPLLRLGTLVYFASIVFYFSAAPIILTAELKTAAAWVPLLQLAIAIAVLFRRGALLSALGIVVLYAYGAGQYGLFHMLDYPFFLGLAAFLALDATYGQKMQARALGILRLTVGVSLIWCGVEKWLYPAWTQELLQSDLQLLLATGFSPAVIIMGAGFVEFCLAFLLIVGRLAAQIAAMVLLAVMLSAVPVVGMVDLIGHLPILIVLVVLATTGNSLTGQGALAARHATPSGLAVSFIAAVPGFIGAYYLSHEIAYGVLGRLNWLAMGIAGLLVAALLMRIARLTPIAIGVSRGDDGCFLITTTTSSAPIAAPPSSG